MSRTGQISIARAGEPLELFFDESALKEVVEEKTNPGSHVTMYPGDYTSFDRDSEIEIPRNTSITILPGATVDYFEDYGEELFSRPTDSERPSNSINEEGEPNHPLATNQARRYIRPNFTGHVENIIDMNFGSEWAFQDSVDGINERLKTVEGTIGGFVATVEVEGVEAAAELEFQGILEFRSDENIDINFGTFTRSVQGGGEDKEGIFVKFSRPELGDVISKALGGDRIEMRDGNVTGDITVDHEEVETNRENISTTALPNPKNPSRDTSAYIKDVVTDDYGHLDKVVYDDVANIKNREPRSNDGKDGDIWFVGERNAVRDIFVRTGDPNQFSGEDGDIWFVNDEGVNVNGQEGKVIVNEFDGGPETSDGENGDLWFPVPPEPDPDGDGNPPAGSNDTVFDIKNILFKQRSPQGSDGGNLDIWTTELNQ